MLNLAIALSQEGESVDLVLVTATGPYLNQVPAEVNVVDLKRTRTLSSLPALISYLRKTRPKAIISALDHANLVAIWAKYLAFVPTKVLVTMHSNLSQLMAQTSHTRGGLIPTLMKAFFPFADKIVAVSKGVENDIKNIFDFANDQLTTILNPVIPPNIAMYAKQPVEHPWFQTAAHPIIIGIGRLSAEKDFASLITAFATVRKFKDARLMILGEGEQRQALEALITDLKLNDVVTLPGFVNNPYAYLSKAQLFVLSSRFEGLPTVLIEALALGIPVVATDCESGPREILRDGELGELVPVGDSDALASAIIQSLDRTQAARRPDVIAPYTFKTAARHYSSLIST